jgi:hypothetical protein
MEVISNMTCSCTKEPVITFVWDSRAKEIRFYTDPNLSKSIIKYDLNIDRVTNSDDPKRYDAILNCPVCGEPITYQDVPNDWQCLPNPGTVISIPISKMTESGTVKMIKLDKKGRRRKNPTLDKKGPHDNRRGG